MDLSQQELPITAYFRRSTKESKSRAVQSRKNEDSQPVARSSKRRKSSAHCSTASPSGTSAVQSKSTLQLPTPATSTRKRARNGCPESQAKTPLTSTVELGDLTQLDSVEPTPSKVPQSSLGAELTGVHLATPFTGRRRTTKSMDAGYHPDFSYADDDATPRTLSQRIPNPLTVHGIHDHSPLARSDRRLPSESNRVSPRPTESAVSHTMPSHVRRPTCLTVDVPLFVDLESPDPFHAPEKERDLEQPDSTFVPLKQLSRVHTIPTIPVPSSQSQYLLHPDATPKRKRYFQLNEHVISSQTQEERELTLSMPHRPAMTSSIKDSPGKHMRGDAQLPCTTLKRAKCDSNPVRSSISSPTRTKKVLDTVSSQSSNSSRHKRSTPYHTPSRIGRTPRRSPRHNSIENIPPAQVDDSVTESESESDVLQIKMKAKLHTTLDPPSRDINQVSHRPSIARDVCPAARCEGKLVGVEDDSATEAESDTEISRRIIEMSAKRPRKERSEAMRENTPPPPIISPLVSPATLRIATVPPTIPSESLPSVVQDFIRMFPGDESYPADFPESLRV